MNHYAIYMNSGNRAIIRAETCEHTSANKIIFKMEDSLNTEIGIFTPGQIVGIFNFNNIEGIECLGEVNE